jgi:hypothetical protein|tara:strand:+ start:243 stop:869 length:627 start_codon:yes stop_codon:yes gene_type:complete
MDIQIIKHFGPSIAKTKIPKDIVNQLNSYIDKIIVDEQKTNKLNMGLELAGDVTQEFKLEREFMNKSGWLNFLANVTREWINSHSGEKITKFEMIESWVVRQFKNEYNPIHWHSGHISGAGFLKLPQTFGSHFQDKKDKNYVGGTLNFIHGSKQFLSDSKFKVIPKVGDFYFFPHYLMHTVYPFKGTDEERRSISFNANIDSKIFNTR